MLYAAFDCVSTVNNVLVYLVNHLFVYVWAFTQIQSYSTGFSPVLRHGKHPIYWCSDLEMDVIQSVWMRIYCQQCVSILNRSSICVCMGFYSNSIILNRVFTGLASWKISYISTLRSTNRRCTQHLIAYLLSMMRLHPWSILYSCVSRLRSKLIRIQPGFHWSRVMENILYIDAQIYTSMSHAAFDCVSTLQDVCVYLINHLFVCVWAFTQANSYSTGFSLVARHGKYPIHWCSDLHIDVARSIWLRIYYQWRVCILNQSSICVCMGFYSS